MAYRYFASRTIYQIIATLETLFSIIIFAFGIKTVANFLTQESSFQSGNQIVLWSGSLGITVSLIQVISAIALILTSRGPNAFDKDDLSISSFPKYWFLLAIVNFGLLLFIFIGPLLIVERPGEHDLSKGLKTFPVKLRQSFSNMFTYVVANAIFKILFLWATFTTIRFRNGRYR